MFAVIIISIIAAIVISNINVTIEATHNYDIECECVKCQKATKEIRNMSKLNVKSIEEYAAVYAQWVSVDTSVEALVNKLEEVTIEGNGHIVTAYRLENATAVKKYFGKISGNLMIWTITRKSDNKTVTFCSVAIGNDNFSNVEYHVRSKVFFGMGNIDNVLPGDQVVRVYNN